VDIKTKQILATAFGRGKMHDFKLFGNSRLAMATKTKCLADSGYLGIAKVHANSQIPHKKSKLQEEQTASAHKGAKARKPSAFARAVPGGTRHPPPQNLSHFGGALSQPAQAVYELAK
jgi:hypothetical protein